MSNTQMLENGKMAMAIDGSWALDWMKELSATLGAAVTFLQGNNKMTG